MTWEGRAPARPVTRERDPPNLQLSRIWIVIFRMPRACVQKMRETDVSHCMKHGGTDILETRIQRVEKLFEIETVAVAVELLFIRT